MSKSLSRKAAMAKGVLLAVLTPKLAADAMPDLNAILTGVSRKNWLTKKPGIIAALKPAFAADADLEGLVKLLDTLDGEGAVDEDDDMNMDDKSGILDMLRGKISDEDLAAVEGKLKGMSAPAAPAAAAAADEPPAFAGKPEVGAGPAAGAEVTEKPEKDDSVSKPAMDAAIKAGVDAAVARVNAMHEAKQVVKPYVGELAIACDSAEGVYKAALKLMNVETKDLHPSAYRSVLLAQPVPGADSGKQRIAQDSSKPSGYADFMKDLGLNA